MPVIRKGINLKLKIYLEANQEAPQDFKAFATEVLRNLLDNSVASRPEIKLIVHSVEETEAPNDDD